MNALPLRLATKFWVRPEIYPSHEAMLENFLVQIVNIRLLLIALRYILHDQQHYDRHPMYSWTQAFADKSENSFLDYFYEGK